MYCIFNLTNSLYFPLHHVTYFNNLDTNDNTRLVSLINWGLVSYTQAWEKQKDFVNERLNDPSLNDLLIMVEHPPVYTLGTGADLKFLKFDPEDSPWEIHRIGRGGEVTYHCPGQLVVYPIFNLKYYQMDLHWYLRQLEEVIIKVLAKYDLNGYRIPKFTGVWLEGAKVAAIGIKVRRWITMHGFALNVCPDMEGFKNIVPCGIEDKPVGKLTDFIPNLTVEEVCQDIIIAFAKVFNIVVVS